MKDIEVEIVEESHVIKRSTSKNGYKRMLLERASYSALRGSPYIPIIKNAKDENGVLSLTLEYINGESAKQWLLLSDDWICSAVSWNLAKQRVSRYVTIEMDLIRRGAMYRDLNFEHIIFAPDSAKIVDLEATIINTDSLGRWALDSTRGTWETMASEEFPGRGWLTERTATYRVACFAYLVLVGRPAFDRSSSRSDTYSDRKNRTARMANNLPKPVQKVFASALAYKPTHRHKNPQSFFNALSQAFDKDNS